MSTYKAPLPSSRKDDKFVCGGGRLMGGPASKIVEYAEAQQNSLIAMCTQGRTGLGRWVLGSVTDAVIRAGNTPVLVMPHGEDG